MRKTKHQSGNLYLAANKTVRLKYWTFATGDRGEQIRKRVDVFVSNLDATRTAEKRTGKWVFSSAVLQARDRIMVDQNERQSTFQAAVTRPNAKPNTNTIAGFWDAEFIPWAQSELRKSTRRGYVGIWKSHLKKELGSYSFLDYTTPMASAYLTRLAEKGLTGTTSSHIRAVASGIFSHAIGKGLLPAGSNPWADAISFKKYAKSKPTEYYTNKEAVAIIDSLTDQPGWSALLGLCYYTGLRPSEAVAVRFEDFTKNGSWHLNVKRAFVDGVIAEPKTEESTATLVVPDPLAKLLMAWHRKCGFPKSGWLFPAEGGQKPLDLHNLNHRHLKKRITGFKGLYALRRSAATHVQGTVGILAAQALLRHSKPSTTESAYAKLTSADRASAATAFNS